MRLDIIYIINNKLHNLKYLNFTIAFYIIFFYTCYSLYVYLINKNYSILLLYVISFILLYSYYKNFTYFIGFAMLIIFKLFNIDNIINNNVIIEGNDFPSLMNSIEADANKEGDDLENEFKNNKPPNNPCKSYIIDKVQEAGIKISNTTFNSQSKKSSTEAGIEDILRGHHSLVRPKIHKL